MSERDYEYDVAFSFHSADETLATELNDLIQDRFDTFLYTKKQEVLAGTDGEETFNAVFGEKARCVVVFYRPEWGETPFTRIEQTAIRNRAFEKGFEFTIFIPTGDPPAVPPWLPKTRLWYGFERFGLKGAAAVIEARVQELGGEPRLESVSDRAVRFERANSLREARKFFRASEDGVGKANAAFDRLTTAIETKSAEITSTRRAIQLKVRNIAGYQLVGGLGPVMAISWSAHYSNSLDSTSLDVDLLDGVPRLPGLLVLEDPRRLKSLKFDYDLLGIDRHGYVERKGEKRSFSVYELAEHLLRIYFDAADEFKPR